MKIFTIILAEIVILLSLFIITLLPAQPAMTLLMKNEVVIEKPHVETLKYLSEDFIHNINGTNYKIGLNRDFLLRNILLFIIKMKYIILVFLLLPIAIKLRKVFKRKFIRTQ